MAGFSLYNTGYDYFSLGNLASGTVIRASLELPSYHNMVPQLEVIDAADSVACYASTGTAQVLNLDGASDYVRHTTTNFNPRSGTVAGWIFPRESYDWGFWQTHDSTSYNWTDWIAMFAYTDNTFYFRTGNGSSGTAQDLTFYPSSATIPPYQWSHLAFTWEDTSLKMYVNGALRVSRSNVTLQDTMDPYALMGVGHTRWLNGWLEDMSVWNRVLSQAEIQTVSAGPLVGSESGLVGYWDFDGDLLDASSSGNNGELFGDASLVADAISPYAVQTNLEYITDSSGIYYVRINSGYGGNDVRSQYIVHLSTYDSTMPVITDETLPAAGSTNAIVFDDFSVTFSEEMEVSTVTNSVNFELLSAGDDDAFGTGDDSAYTMAVSYTAGLTASFNVVDGPLQPGRIRFVAGTNVTDRSGTPLLAYTNIFRVVGVDGYLFEDRDNDTDATADSLNLVSSNLFDGSFSVAQIVATGDQPLDMVSGFFNADTNLDLAVANYAGDSVTIFLGNGDTTFVTATNIAVGDGPHSIVTGDFNADGNLDLATANNISDNITVLFGNGSGGYTNAASYYCGDGPNPYGLGRSRWRRHQRFRDRQP